MFSVRRRSIAFATVLVVLAALSPRLVEAASGPCAVTPNGSGWSISCTPTTSASPINQSYNGGNGGDGNTGAIFVPPTNGGNGGTGQTVTLTFPQSGGTQLINSSGPALIINDNGGSGGAGGDADACACNAADGGSGGNGGSATITIGPSLSLLAQGGPGIFAQSTGGNGGNGGNSNGGFNGGNGAGGGTGGFIYLTADNATTTFGQNAFGILAQSNGGNGGSGGGGYGIVGQGGNSGSSEAGGNVIVLLGQPGIPGSIATYGTGADGILAQSIGGFGGNGGNGGGITAVGGNSSNGGNGGTISVVTVAGSSIVTFGATPSSNDAGSGIVAQSIGGGGGEGGSGGSLFYSAGSAGSPGGAGFNVNVNNNGSITTNGAGAKGIIAQSIGGGGGDGGSGNSAVIGIGGNGASTSSGGSVNVSNSGAIVTNSTNALGAGALYGNEAILAQSIGGGGGNGGSSAGLFSVGGAGGGGGNGGAVSVENPGGSLTTYAPFSDGVLEQSIGGGGGNGGGAIAYSIAVSSAIGGSASAGGTGGPVTFESQLGSIATAGNWSTGVAAQSIGGGGGSGGFAVSVSGSPIAGSLAFGGTGGGGGNGGSVTLSNGNTPNDATGTAITTLGTGSNGILAQSIGGGGGLGGYAVAGAVGLGAFSAGLGGVGGSGGSGAAVMVDNAAAIATLGQNAVGILAQSIGGGGGDGGFAITGDVGASVGAGFSFGGKGGGGGAGGPVTIQDFGSETTSGNDAAGIVAQSIGGGGGNGGLSATGNAGYNGALGFSLGGTGGSGGSANVVNLTIGGYGSIATAGNRSDGILAQSIGGGGGNGGESIGGAFSVEGGASVAIGGDGAAGGNGGAITATNSQSIATTGNDSSGVVLQSIGGGGGNGGFAVAGSISGGNSFNASVGGSGSSGGLAGNIDLTSVDNSIVTSGARANGLEVQSIGGGGGNGGFAVGGSVTDGNAIAVAVGGAGGAGSSSGNISILAGGQGPIATGHNTGSTGTGDFSNAIVAQSIAGGGGSGGFGIAGSIGTDSLALGIGGGGGSGGSAGTVTVEVGDSRGGYLSTDGAFADGILAQSIGGGGGNGGFSVAGALGNGSTLTASVGGAGATGGTGNSVSVYNFGLIVTNGNDSDAIVAQSIGGGGGAGGFAVAGGLAQNATANVALGGRGGAGSSAGSVFVESAGSLGSCAAPAFCPTSANTIDTVGDGSVGILAQSIAGGGGTGGFSIVGSASNDSVAAGVSIGGAGGAAGASGTVTVNADANIQTGAAAAGGGPAGNNAPAILAQSIGAGGGAGGFSIAGGAGSSFAAPISIGGAGGGNNPNRYLYASSAVTVISQGALSTNGNDSPGIDAESIGGSGGDGGFSLAGSLSAQSGGGLSVGGNGGTFTRGSSVTVTNSGAGIQTRGNDSSGILAESIGGNGGNGGLSAAGGFGGEGGSFNLSIGGGGGFSAVAGTLSDKLTVTNGSATAATPIVTSGARSNGIAALALGGNGGNGGASFSGSGGGGGPVLGLSIGGNGGEETFPNAPVLVTDFGNITTGGDLSNGILAQGIGGNGGNGGLSVAAALSTQEAGGISVGGFGAEGSHGGNVTVNYGDSVNSVAGGTIATAGMMADGILAQSIGGGGGNGGLSVAGSLSSEKNAALAIGGFGNGAGNGQTVIVNSVANAIVTKGASSGGIVAQSIGGGGGNGGAAVGAGVSDDGSTIGATLGGFGGDGGSGGSVTVASGTPSLAGTIGTSGAFADGIEAQSIGGGGGDGGWAVTGSISNDANGLSLGMGGNGGNAGDAGIVTVTANTAIATSGDFADGILAQSVGGGGGNGGFSVSSTISNASSANLNFGGAGSTAGNAGAVSLTSLQNVTTNGNFAGALVAQSIGGGGGNGGFSVGAGYSGEGNQLSDTFGGNAGAAGSGDAVTLTSGSATAPVTLVTNGASADGILAQSIGGGGGNGGFALNVSATAKNGGQSAAATFGMHAFTIGYNTCTVCPGGGAGGDANNAGSVTVTSHSAIGTHGDDAVALAAQSIGGGGGSGGLIVGATLEETGAGAQLEFGSGGGGGQGANVNVTTAGNLVTVGAHADGLLAQSIGGGGGFGGITATNGLIAAIPGVTGFNLGQFGSAAGDAGNVTVTSASSIQTGGNGATGLAAQSIGGGGGDGGYAVSGGLSFEPSITASTLNYALGATGGAGGMGGTVAVTSTAKSITTAGTLADAILAQSIGGGGGNGGFAVNGAYSPGWTMGVSMGGAGGSSGVGGAVTVANSSTLVTTGDLSGGIVAQSIGGGGGSGGFALEGTGSADLGAATAIGGSSTAGSNAGTVALTNSGSIATSGAAADAILAQSIGGGGGNGGFAAASALNPNGATATIGLGASGSGGGSGMTAGVVNTAASISTKGANADGIAAQSIGGGGGDGGFSTGAGLNGTGGFALSLGGSGGAAGDGGAVTVTSGLCCAPATSITTSGANADALVAQSIGGGGGNAGFIVSGANATPLSTGLVLGGSGGSAGSGGTASITNASTLTTTGNFANALLAQSIGGGGGNASIALLSPGASPGSGNIVLGAATPGCASCDAGAVTVANTANLSTAGVHAGGIVAQSIGGGGGNAGIDDSRTISAGTVGVASTSRLGDTGSGAAASANGNAGGVTVSNSGAISTQGDVSSGITAQSVGGGGGTGAAELNGTPTGTYGLNLGAAAAYAAGAGDGGAVNITTTGSAGIKTNGFAASPIFGQSVGGGGGDSATAFLGPVSATGLALQFGESGSGGAGGTVSVTNTQNLTSAGQFASEVFAQSVGGGGGAGGFWLHGGFSSNLSDTFGAPSGSGSNAAGVNVNATNSGNLVVDGKGAYGLFAQSVGGGGGAGGFIGSVNVNWTGLGVAGAQVDDSLGVLNGSNAMSSRAGIVTATLNGGSIQTQGIGDDALVAQSVGGGGGDAGFGLKLNPTAVANADFLVSLGSSTQNGSGGSVNVTNTNATVETLADNALGLLAQSIGGGGGNGGFQVNGNLGSVASIGVHVGGASSQDQSRTVTLKSTGAIATAGNGSTGIQAQSIAGGGGNGGFTFSGGLTTGMPASTKLVVGGGAGGNGNGGTLALATSGSISTGAAVAGLPTPAPGTILGDRAIGILGQSIGGGGGNGFIDLTLSPMSAATAVPGAVGVALGGGAATANSGGTVGLTSSTTIGTHGTDASGIELQSIGGGGGNADSETISGSLTPTGKAPGKFGLTVGVGGQGGGGDAGGSVTLVQNGVTSTAGQGADAMLAQSIGGGGGRAIARGPSDGTALTGCSGITNAQCDLQLTSLAVTLGGTGGVTSSDPGGNVSVTVANTVSTLGSDANGIVAQSIGGGGGIALDAHTSQSAALTAWNVAVGGGSGPLGTNGNGGTVAVTESANMSTAGAGSSAILAQSVGGGGGIAGGGGASGEVAGKIKLGGAGGAVGNGGNVTVNVNNGTAGTPSTPTSKGKAGTVKFKISTTGAAAFGVFAQSVGGGGGVAGNLDAGISKSTIGSGSTETVTGGSGNGGTVNVSQLGAILTSGAAADGIFGQSVGGGGGLAGSTVAGALGFAGSAGGSGSGGAVSITDWGPIQTGGTSADGIFAQSAGGKGGSGGAVTVNAYGSVLAFGTNADGIFAQSTGGAANGNVAVTVGGNAIVQGGHGSGAGVRILGGSNNSIVNYGTITTVDLSGQKSPFAAGAASPMLVALAALPATAVALNFDPLGLAPSQNGNSATTQIVARRTAGLTSRAGTDVAAFTPDSSTVTNSVATAGTADGDIAIFANSGTLTITNYGTITGNVVTTGAHVKTVTNAGALVLGSSMTADTVLNTGVISAGGGVATRAAQLNGDFNQTSGAELLTDLDFKANQIDMLTISGNASVSGKVGISMLDPGYAAPGTYDKTILTAGSLTTSDLTMLQPSAVVSFRLTPLGTQDLGLGYTVNFMPQAAGLTSNELAIASYISRAQAAGPTASFAPLVAGIVAQPTAAALRGAYDAVTPNATLPLQSSALLANLDFADALLTCRNNAGLGLTDDADNCNWGSLGALHRTQTGGATSVGFDRSSTGLSAGYARGTANGKWTVGGGLSYDNAGLSSSGHSSLAGNGVQAGVLASRNLGGGSQLSAGLVAGAGNYATTRSGSWTNPTITSNGNAKLRYAGAHLRASHELIRGHATLVPFVDLGATNVGIAALNETGAGGSGANLAAHAQTFVTAESGVHLATVAHARKTMFQPALDLSVMQVVGNTQSSVTGSFAGAPAAIAPFTLTNRLDRTFLKLTPSLTISHANGFDLRVGANYAASAGSHGFNAFLQIGKKM